MLAPLLAVFFVGVGTCSASRLASEAGVTATGGKEEHAAGPEDSLLEVGGSSAAGDTGAWAAWRKAMPLALGVSPWGHEVTEALQPPSRGVLGRTARGDGHALSAFWSKSVPDVKVAPTRPAPRNRELEAKHPTGWTHPVVVPERWVDTFYPAETPELVLVEAHKDSCRFQARLWNDPKFWVEVSARGSDDEQKRESFVAKLVYADHQQHEHRVPGCGVALASAFMQVDGMYYVLRPLGDGDLHSMLQQKREAGMDHDKIVKELFGEPGGVKKNSLILQSLVDMLYGLVTLESAGVVHGEVGTESIAVKAGRAYIARFRSACVTGRDDGGDFACSTLGDTPEKLLPSSAYRQAPERTNQGAVTGPENDVWGVGLVFAELCLGFLPTAEFGPDHPMADTHYDMREEIRQDIRDNFRIEDAKGFAQLPGYMRELLLGLLQKDPAKRWDARKALKAVGIVSKARGFHMRKTPGQLDAPLSWFIGVHR